VEIYRTWLRAFVRGCRRSGLPVQHPWLRAFWPCYDLKVLHAWPA